MFQVAHRGALVVALGAQALDLGVEPGGILRQQRETAVQQLALEPGEVGAQGIAPVAKALNFRRQGGVARG